MMQMQMQLPMQLPTQAIAAILALMALDLTPTATTTGDTSLEPPVRLKAGDSYIDTGELIGHSGPLFADVFQRGVPDLLVGNFRGNILVFRNEPEDGRPSLKAAGMLEADGEPIRVPNW